MRICKTLGSGFTRLWKRIREDLQGFARLWERIYETFGEDS